MAWLPILTPFTFMFALKQGLRLYMALKLQIIDVAQIKVFKLIYKVSPNIYVHHKVCLHDDQSINYIKFVVLPKKQPFHHHWPDYQTGCLLVGLCLVHSLQR